jgi:hypothetical protein
MIGVPFLAISVPVLDQLTVRAVDEVGLKILVPNPELQGYTKTGVPEPVPVAKYVPSGLKSTEFFTNPSSVGLAYLEPNPELLTAYAVTYGFPPVPSARSFVTLLNEIV